MITVSTPSDVASVLPLGTLKQHLRIEHADEDAILGIYAAAAVRALERFTGRMFGTSTLTATIAMPPSQLLMVQIPDVRALSSLTITTVDGSVVIVPVNDVVLRSHAYGCLLMPSVNATWPVAAPGDDAITVAVTAGMSPLPDDMRAALLLTAARFFAEREDATLPSAAISLCGPFRTGGWI